MHKINIAIFLLKSIFVNYIKIHRPKVKLIVFEQHRRETLKQVNSFILVAEYYTTSSV